MSNVTFRIDFEIDGVASDPTSIVLSDPTGAYGVKDDSDDSVVVADGTAVTKSATGSYYYTLTTATAGSTYTAYFEYVLGGETYHSSDTQTAASAGLSTFGNTGADIRAELNQRLNRSETTDQCNNYITAAIRRIARMGQWPDLHETDSATLAFTAGDKSKAMPADFEPRGLDRLYVANDRTLEPMAPDTLRGYQELAGAATGDPTHYAILGGNLYVYPIPAATVTVKLDHWAIPAAISDETATLVLGDEFREAVILATMVAYLNGTEGLGTHPKVAESDAKFYAEMATLTGADDRKPCVAQTFRYA